MMEHYKKLLAEFLGIFAIVFFGTGAIIVNHFTDGAITHFGIATVFGLVVAVVIYMFAHVSGAHFNPAVSIALYVSKQLSFSLLGVYIAAQLAGAFAASALLKAMFPLHATLGTTLPQFGVLSSMVFEFIMTFILMLAVFQFSTIEKDKAPLAGLIIGFIILLEALMGGPVSGASMNPARSIAPAVISGNLQYLWIYIAMPIAGALFAIPIARLLK